MKWHEMRKRGFMETDYLTNENQKWLATRPDRLDNVLEFRQNIAQLGNENIHHIEYSIPDEQ
jgi:hypothetical protein